VIENVDMTERKCIISICTARPGCVPSTSAGKCGSQRCQRGRGRAVLESEERGAKPELAGDYPCAQWGTWRRSRNLAVRRPGKSESSSPPLSLAVKCTDAAGPKRMTSGRTRTRGAWERAHELAGDYLCAQWCYANPTSRIARKTRSDRERGGATMSPRRFGVRARGYRGAGKAWARARGIRDRWRKTRVWCGGQPVEACVARRVLESGASTRDHPPGVPGLRFSQDRGYDQSAVTEGAGWRTAHHDHVQARSAASAAPRTSKPRRTRQLRAGTQWSSGVLW
jgi:hypothetical protein